MCCQAVTSENAVLQLYAVTAPGRQDRQVIEGHYVRKSGQWSVMDRCIKQQYKGPWISTSMHPEPAHLLSHAAVWPGAPCYSAATVQSIINYAFDLLHAWHMQIYQHRDNLHHLLEQSSLKL